MKHVLLVGQEPETVDFSDPALPPGLNAEKIRGGIAAAMKQMTDRGWRPNLCLVRPDESAGATLERHLASTAYDCVVIGGGVRIPPRSRCFSRRSSTPCTSRLRMRISPSIRNPKTPGPLLPDG